MLKVDFDERIIECTFEIVKGIFGLLKSTFRRPAVHMLFRLTPKNDGFISINKQALVTSPLKKPRGSLAVYVRPYCNSRDTTLKFPAI
jgi:hypothetical protein